jgi:hypothetical protein
MTADAADGPCRLEGLSSMMPACAKPVQRPKSQAIFALHGSERVEQPFCFLNRPNRALSPLRADMPHYHSGRRRGSTVSGSATRSRTFAPSPQQRDANSLQAATTRQPAEGRKARIPFWRPVGRDPSLPQTEWNGGQMTVNPRISRACPPIPDMPRPRRGTIETLPRWM